MIRIGVKGPVALDVFEDFSRFGDGFKMGDEGVVPGILNPEELLGLRSHKESVILFKRWGDLLKEWL